MKKTFSRIFLLMLSLVLIFSLASCKKKASITEYTIKASEEALQKIESMLKSGGNYYFQEEFFNACWEPVINNEPQPVPSVETKNTMEVFSFMDQDVYTLSDGDFDSVVLYIHGGAWVYQIETVHIKFCDELVSALNAKVYMPIYDLAPNATYRETIAFVSALYQDLLSLGKPIYVMGDSAGGTISLDLMYNLKANKIEIPSRLVLLAPCSDLSFSNPEMEEIEKDDPCLAIYGCREFAKLWADGEENLKDPEVSALYADLSGYPKTMLIQGTADILSSDNYKLCDKLNEAGVEVTLVKGEGLFHVFCVYDIPEKQEAIKLISEFVK